MSNGTTPRTRAYGRTAEDVDVFGTNKYKDIATGYTNVGPQLTGGAIDTDFLAGRAAATAGPGGDIGGPTAAGVAIESIGKGIKGFGQKIGAGAASGKDPGAIGQIAAGFAGVAGGLIGGRARRREQREARQELKQARAAYEQFEFKDPTAGMTNPFEDMTVNLQQAQFESQQQQQALAGTLAGLSSAAGGSGVGALAQALAQQKSANLQRSAASIGMQESQQQFAKAQGAQQLQQARARGAQYVQEKEFGRTEDLLNTAAARKAAADEARRKATEGLIGGVANIAAGAGRLVAAGATGGASEAAMSVAGV